jgi:hypothetical protein
MALKTSAIILDPLQVAISTLHPFQMTEQATAAAFGAQTAMKALADNLLASRHQRESINYLRMGVSGPLVGSNNLRGSPRINEKR